MKKISVGIKNWQEMVSLIAATKVPLSGHLHTLLSATSAELPIVAFQIDGKLKVLRPELLKLQDCLSGIVAEPLQKGPGNYLYMLERRIEAVLLQRLIERALESVDIFDRSMRAFIPVFSTIQFAESSASGYSELERNPYPGFEMSLATLEECNDKFQVFSFRHGHLIIEACSLESRNKNSVVVQQLLGEVDTLEILHSWLVSLYKDLNSPSPDQDSSQNASNISELIDLNWDVSIVPARDLVQAATQHYRRVLMLTLSWVESMELRLAKLLFN